MWQDARDRLRDIGYRWSIMGHPTPVRLTFQGMLEQTKPGEPHDGWAMQCMCCGGVFMR